jgi:hypothetical protein
MRGEKLNRTERLKDDPCYKKCLILNGEREKDRPFCRHDFRHMLDVSLISQKIIAENGNLALFAGEKGLPVASAEEVIYAAGLLHDIGRWRQYDTGEDHALAGALMARAILERCGFLKNEIEIITRAIKEHRRSGPGTSYLGRVICLADDLSRPCGTCKARSGCYKSGYMENLKKAGIGLMRELGTGS